MHRILCIRRKLLETCRLRVRFCPAGIGRRLQRGGKQQKRRLAKSLTAGHDCRDRHNSIGADYAESVHNSGFIALGPQVSTNRSSVRVIPVWMSGQQQFLPSGLTSPNSCGENKPCSVNAASWFRSVMPSPVWTAPVQALREASPQARRGFTVADQVNQLVGASEADPNLGFMARMMVLCSLPRHQPRQPASVQARQRPLPAPTCRPGRRLSFPSATCRA